MAEFPTLGVVLGSDRAEPSKSSKDTSVRRRSLPPQIPSPSSSLLVRKSDSDSEHGQTPEGTSVQDLDPSAPIEKRRELDTQVLLELESKTPFDHFSYQGHSENRGRARRRRSANADVGTKAKRWFNSPDRYVSPRPSSNSPESPIRLSKAPHSLSPQEKYARQRDDNVDPFRSARDSGSRQALARGQLGTGPRSSPMHFTPSFVHGNDAAPVHVDANGTLDIPRQVSAGAVWHVGGPLTVQNGPTPGISDGHGGLLGGGTNAPMHLAHFLDRETSDQDLERHENRLALALDIDQAKRILGTHPSFSPLVTPPLPDMPTTQAGYAWRNNSWVRQDGRQPGHGSKTKAPERVLPSTPFRVLDAPRLRDDFYCSTLAYSYTRRTLAVGLSNRVYLWSEEEGVQYPPLASARAANYVTSVSFSSTEGGHSILAVGRQGGQVSLWDSLETEPKCEAPHQNPVSCLCFKPMVTRRFSEYSQDQMVACEDLLVGDDLGIIYYYSVEWPEASPRPSHQHWTGTMTLLARISAHSQQICGLAWSPDGKYFVSGGNDNAALLFEISKVISNRDPFRGRSILRQEGQTYPTHPYSTPPVSPERVANLSRLFDRAHRSITSSPTRVPAQTAQETTAYQLTPPYLLTPSLPYNLPTPSTSPTRLYVHGTERLHRIRPAADINAVSHPPGLQKRTFPHSAAVKALAFAPWRSALLATGGGSNDRQIHFFHTESGATLALISVWAQVTSLIWSKTRREIAATFGYAQPEHGIRIAVFAWPSGECVVSIPWGRNGADPGGLGPGGGDGGRALWAIPYPGGPNNCSIRRGRNEDRGEGEAWGSRTEEEGCIIVAGSDESVKFHEIWAGRSAGAKGKGLGMSPGVLGGSSILEGVCEGIDASSGVEEVIR